MSALPAVPLPPNPSEPGRGPVIMGLTWTFAGLAIIATALRVYVRKTVANGISWDDWLMCIAVCFNIVSQSFVTIAYTHGLGKHDVNLTPDQMMGVLKWMWLANTPGLLVSIFARISIAVLLIRLFGIHRWLRWYLIIFTAICTVLTIVVLPCTYLQSTPVSGNWNPFAIEKRWDPIIYMTLAYLSQSLWTFSDLTFVLFPILVIWRLQMALRQRVGLALIMSVSLLTMALSILKTIGLKTIAEQQADPTAKDVEYNASLMILWSCLEQAFVIIMGCVPPLRALAKLEMAKSISISLSSFLRRAMSPSIKSSDTKPAVDGWAIDSLQMSSTRTGQPNKGYGLPFTAEATHSGHNVQNQHGAVESNRIISTTERSLAFNQREDIV
ncbi:hypothetical protein PG997_002605 [Apiospora hydei]|uniref:Rhodopsin domain-containing protein n=1 Tax=Apiospora hydei TaxID=1337664 RepID=A0ABR1WWW2_9PEZI